MNTECEICLVGGTLFNVLSVYKKRVDEDSNKITDSTFFSEILEVLGTRLPAKVKSSSNFTKMVSSYKYCIKNEFQDTYFPLDAIQKLQEEDFPNVCSRMVHFVECFMMEEERKSIIAALKKMIESDKSISEKETFVVDSDGTKRTRRQLSDQLGFSFIPFLTSVFLYSFSRTNTLGKPTIDSWSVERKVRREIVVPRLDVFYKDSIYLIEEVEPLNKEMGQGDFDEKSSDAVAEYDYKYVYHYSEQQFDKIFIEVAIKPYEQYDRSKTFQFFHLNISESTKFELEGMIRFLQNNLAQYFYSQAECREMFDKGTYSMAGHSAIKNMTKFYKRGMLLPDKALGEILISIFLEIKGNAHKIMSKVQLEKDIQLADSRTDGVHLGKDGTLYFASSCVDGDLLKAVDSAFDRILTIRENSDTELLMVKENAFKMLKDKNDIRILDDAIVPKPREGISPKKGYGIFLGYDIALGTVADGDDYLQMVKSKIVRDAEICYEHVRKLVSIHDLWKEKITFFLLPFDNVERDVQFAFEKIIEE